MIHPNTRHNRTRHRRLAPLASAAAGLALALAAAPARADAQAREMLNRLVQTTTNSADPAARAFEQGRSLINEQKWEQAASTFDRFVAQYPSDKNVDAALYWLAYVHHKQGNLRAASATLDRLLQNHARSTWADDAKALRLEVRSKLNPGSVDVPAEGTDDLKIIALKALCENDKPGCSARVGEVLRSGGASPRVKEAAIILLGRYGGAEAVPALIQMSRAEPNEKLRMRAIRALGSTNDERALDVLREIAAGATFADESPADSAIHALAEHDSPRAVALLGEVVTRGQHLRARTHAVEMLSRRRGEPALAELLRLFDAVPELQVKKYVLAGLGNRKDPRALNKLIEVARTSPEVQLRAQAIRAIPHRGEAQDLDVLISLYDAERDNELKDNLLASIGHYQNPRAYQKLQQIVRNNAEPIERRKAAISHLSRSKDPQVLEFLKQMIQ